MAQKLSEVILGSDNARKARAWCFTCNNYENEDEIKIRKMAENGTEVYIIYGKEKGESGTPHLQGYIHLKNARTMKSLKKELAQKFHFEIARGSCDENVRYCSKEGDITEFGTKPKQGKRIDIEKFIEDIENGDSDDELWQKHPSCMVKYRNAKCDRRNVINGKKERGEVKVIVLIGKPGSGKTRYVMEKEEKIWNAPGDYRWYDGYCGQEAVLFDDYEGEIEYRMLLKLLDRYKMQVPVKGGFVWWLPKRIYITSNVKIERWYPRKEIDALKRRITEIVMTDKSD